MYSVSLPAPPVIVTVGLVTKEYPAPIEKLYGVPADANGNRVRTVPLVRATRLSRVCSAFVVPAPPPPPPEITTGVHAVALPLASRITWPTCVESPQAPVFEFTVARVVATDPVPDAVTSPVRAVMPPPPPPPEITTGVQ